MKQRIWWFTGLSGSGKTTLAKAMKKHLDFCEHKCVILDGDSVRKGLCKDLGFSEEDRMENLRRVSWVVRMFWEEGYSVICCFVSPTESGRSIARDIISRPLDPMPRVKTVYISTPLEVCEARDPKGLYKKARAGEIPNFTGIGQPYEEPCMPDYTFDLTDADLNDVIIELTKDI